MREFLIFLLWKPLLALHFAIAAWQYLKMHFWLWYAGRAARVFNAQLNSGELTSKRAMRAMTRVNNCLADLRRDGILSDDAGERGSALMFEISENFAILHKELSK